MDFQSYTTVNVVDNKDFQSYTIPLKSEYDAFTQCMKRINLANNYGYNRVVCDKLHPIYTAFLLKQRYQIQKKQSSIEITMPTNLRRSKR